MNVDKRERQTKRQGGQASKFLVKEGQFLRYIRFKIKIKKAPRITCKTNTHKVRLEWISRHQFSKAKHIEREHYKNGKKMKRKKTSDFTSLGFVFDLVSWTKRWNKGDDVIRCSCDNWLLYPQTMYSFLTIELLEMLRLSLLFDPYSASYIYGDQNSTMYLSVGSIY